jgi:signal transduction histidine kinase/ligand-binding sensor domain-containing protein/DNA-binding response OmpR family regulator
MKNRTLLLLLLLFFALSLMAQHRFSFTHYTSDNGLSQNSITAIMKDSKGYVWLGTRDGLNKFDGYNFTHYNSKPQKKQTGLSNRILTIREDKWGYIWVKTYDEIVYRVNPSTEELQQVSNPDGSVLEDKIREFYVLPSGKVWLNTFAGDLLVVDTDPETHTLTFKKFVHPGKNPRAAVVNLVEEDELKTTWILSEGGICAIDSLGKQSCYFESVPVRTLTENTRRIVFGGANKLIVFDKQNSSFAQVQLPIEGSVRLISHVGTGKYLMVLDNNGFLTYDLNRPEWKHYNRKSHPQMKTNDIRSIYIDRSEEVWLEIADAGVLHYLPPSGELEYIATRVNEGQVINPNYLIFEDSRDVLWIQPYYGTFSHYNRPASRLESFHSAYHQDINVLFSYGVNHALTDQQGIIWLSTNRGNGFYRCTFLPGYFEHHLLQSNTIYSLSNEVRALFEDDRQRLWVASKDRQVHVYDKNKNLIGKLGADGTIRKGNDSEFFAYNFFYDRQGRIWMASKRRGLFRLTATSDPLRYSMEHFEHNPANPYSPGNNDFYSVTQDQQGRIWAGSYGAGLHLVDEQNGRIRFLHAGNELTNYPMDRFSKVRQVMVDSRQRLWVATTEGFVMLNTAVDKVKNPEFKSYHVNKNQPQGLGANDVHYIYEDEAQTIWMGTFGGGLSRMIPGTYDNPRFEVYDRSSGMPNNVVYAIVDDLKGNLWLTTDNSIVRFNKTERTIEVFGKGNELENVEFSEAAAWRLSNGEICFGAKSGFYSFNPETVLRKKINAPLVFTRLLLFNKEVLIGDGKKALLSRQLDETSEIRFSHRQNVFTLEFATLDMRAPEKIQYAYRLEGFEDEWNYVDNKHFATYTTLSPGEYTFRVKSTDSEGYWLDNERVIRLKILPSFWNSSFAKFLYVIFILLLFLLTLYIFLTFFKLKNSVLIEKQMTEMKLRFFTDISHELRTPLTLVSLPVDNLLNEQLESPVHEQLVLMRRNLDRVLTLINQILDFRKLQNNKMRLTVEEVHFGEFVKNSCQNFNEIALSRNIDFAVQDDTNDATVWIDTERFDSIIYNLLSNAFKFTEPGKKITVRTFIRQNKVVLLVADEGIGIAREKINFIFDRFFSVPALRNIAQKSTGIGLDLVKKLVDLHRAEIHVESQPGKGSDFEIELLTGTEHFVGDDDVVISEETTLNDTGKEEESTKSEHGHSVIPLILIVEDNTELRQFLRTTLKNNYRVEEAENGLVGWQKTEHLMPDIIIADLRMPEMNGLQLLEKVKTDKRTSHIPVVMLTAVTDMQNKLAGMKAGADDYITKPFSSAFLHARIENLIKQRLQLQQYYRSQLSPQQGVAIKLPPIEVQSQEEQFMKHLIEVMNENIDNFELNIDFLATEMGMSRTVFFNKLKSLTGFSPVEFVREMRVERAADYIRNTNFSMSEISYRVGIEDPRYFSRCFKLKYGMTPSEYRQSIAGD